MKKLVYVLSKNGTVKNYVSELNATSEDGETYDVGLEFNTDIEKAYDLEDVAQTVHDQLANQLSASMVGIVEVV